MPITLKRDNVGYYYQYGSHGKKYYFNPLDKISEKNAYIRAVQQTRAIHVRKSL